MIVTTKEAIKMLGNIQNKIAILSEIENENQLTYKEYQLLQALLKLTLEDLKKGK